jgi:hypothetical protein
MKRLLLVVAGGSALVAQRPTMRAMQPETRALRTRIKTQTKIKRTLVTLGRVALPSMIATGLGFEYYDNLSSFIQANWLDANSIKFLSSDEIQFLPSFLTVISLLFSILAGSAYSSLYAQQEAIYFALYAEVSEAKSLLEQMALVCAGRPFYRDALRAMRAYVKQDLRRLDVAPADLMARPPNEDPLEAIMYLTSVGVPSVVYETVRDLRQARGRRLGAMQRKFPRLGIFLLYLLALLELAAFPLLGAGGSADVLRSGLASSSGHRVDGVGTLRENLMYARPTTLDFYAQAGTTLAAPSTILLVQGALFGGLCGATTLVLRIIQELWRTSGGAFNVDDVLQTMVRGLADELDSRAERLTEDAYAAPDAARGLTPEQQRAFEALDAADEAAPRRRWWRRI